MHKMHEIRLAAGLRPDPLGSLSASKTPSRNQGVILVRGGTFQLTGLRTAQPH